MAISIGSSLLKDVHGGLSYILLVDLSSCFVRSPHIKSAAVVRRNSAQSSEDMVCGTQYVAVETCSHARNKIALPIRSLLTLHHDHNEMGVLIVILDCRSKKRGPTASCGPGTPPKKVGNGWYKG